MKNFILLFVLTLIAIYSAVACADTDYSAFKAALDQKYVEMLVSTMHPEYRDALEQNYLQVVDQYIKGKIIDPPNANATYGEQLAFQEYQELQQFRQDQSQNQNKAQQLQLAETAAQVQKQKEQSIILAGTDAYNKKDYTTTVQLWQPLAEQGNDDAQLGLGILYERGQGFPQDEKQAQFWFCKSVKQGNTDAAEIVSSEATGTANSNPDVVASVYCGQ